MGQGTNVGLANVENCQLEAFRGSQGITAAPDRQTLVFSRRETADRDLMLMEIGR